MSSHRLTSLNQRDLNWVVRRLPRYVREFLEKHGRRDSRAMLAGGFIRAAVANEEISDIDLFSPSAQRAEDWAKALALDIPGTTKTRIVRTKNAITLCDRRLPVQFIHRWTYDSPEALVNSFDFTIARATVWFDEPLKQWKSLCDEDFYADLAAKRLVYRAPVRDEDAGGSMLRVLKFYQRGYRIPMDALAGVIHRLVRNYSPSRGDAKGIDYEQWIAARLFEVDPLIDLTHAAHLPAIGTPTAAAETEVEE